jgi:hypothetical protein
VYRKGRVVAAAVFCVQHQAEIQKFCLQTGVFAVRAHHIQNILRNGKVRVGIPDEHTLVVPEVHGCLIAEHRQRRELCHQLDALPHHIGQTGVIWLGVIGVERQDALRHGVHDIVAGHLHNNAAVEVVGQFLIVCQQPLELAELFLLRKMSHEQQIDDLFEPKAVMGDKALHQLFDGDATVQQLSRRRHFPAVHHLGRRYLANSRQPGTNALAVQVTEPTLYLMFHIEFLLDLIVGRCIGSQLIHQLHIVLILCNHFLDLLGV